MIELLGLLGVSWIVRDGGEALVGGADVVVTIGVARIALNRELELLDGGAVVSLLVEIDAGDILRAGNPIATRASDGNQAGDEQQEFRQSMR